MLAEPEKPGRGQRLAFGRLQQVVSDEIVAGSRKRKQFPEPSLLHEVVGAQHADQGRAAGGDRGIPRGRVSGVPFKGQDFQTRGTVVGRCVVNHHHFGRLPAAPARPIVAAARHAAITTATDGVDAGRSLSPSKSQTVVNEAAGMQEGLQDGRQTPPESDMASNAGYSTWSATSLRQRKSRLRHAEIQSRDGGN